MTCRLCKNYGTCKACRAEIPKITGRDGLEAVAWTLVAYVMAALYLIALQ